jgi:hypothetical protein
VKRFNANAIASLSKDVAYVENYLNRGPVPLDCFLELKQVPPSSSSTSSCTSQY